MERSERLALAVRATVAQARLDEARASGAAPRLQAEAIAAARALAWAWRDGSADVLAWVGCTEAEYREAVETAMAVERGSGA